jgi:hypothetical protein
MSGIKNIQYNSPPGTSGGGGSRRRGAAVNDDLQSTESRDIEAQGEVNGGSKLSANELGLIFTGIGLSSELTFRLVDWGMKGVTWSLDGVNVRNSLNFRLKTAGYIATGIYGYNSFNSFKTGDDLKGFSNGVMAINSFVVTRTGPFGLAVTAPAFIIDWTIGMDNWLKFNNDLHLKRVDEIQNGNLGLMLWYPGRSSR